MLHGLDCLLCPGRNACVVRKGYSFQGFRNCVAQFGSVVLHNDRHLFPIDVGIRRKGGGGNTRHNSGLCRPVHIGRIVSVGFHISEFPGFVAVRVDARQPPQGGDEHTSGHAGVGAEGGVAGAGEQSSAGNKEDVVRSPMLLNVGEGRGRVLVADAVDAEMLCFKNHCFLIRIIAGFGNPLHFAVFIHINRIQVASLLILLRCVRNRNTDALFVQTNLFGLFAVFHFPQRNIVDRSCADSRLCLNRGGSCFLHLQNDVATGLAVQFP